MGISSSSISDLKENEYLKRFIGKDSLSPNDPFWNQLLSFTFTPPKTCADYRLLEENTQVLLTTLLTNNLQTGNFRSLVQVFVSRAAELKASTQCENNIFTWQTYNALFILRCICKFFIETITEENVIKQFEPQLQPGEKAKGNVEIQKENLLDHFLNVLVEIIVDVPVVDFTYALHLEAINTLIVLLSVQMFTSKPASKSTIYKTMMQGKCSIHACLLMKTVLQEYIKQEKQPINYSKGKESGSFIIGLASGIWTVLTLGYGRSNSVNTLEVKSETPLADQSLLLCLILANHCTDVKSINNPYRQALLSFTNSQEKCDTHPTQAVATFKVDYSALFATLCSTLHSDQTTLLLYLLLHRNSQMKMYILSKTNVDLLIIPILKILYTAQDRNSHHIYMALIILLILSEDDLFNKAVHDVMLKNITWYTERAMSEVSLGGLLILVVIRTIQFNMTRMRDKYLHTNCLAALANMSGQFRGLHPYVTQRIVSLFENLAKKHIRILQEINCRADPRDDAASDLMQDLNVLEEVLRMVLEIINSCLANQLAHNPNFVYTLLYKRECFDHFRTRPTFQDIIQNIDSVLSYFSSKLDVSNNDLSVNEVLEIIQEGALHWSGDRMKKFPDLKFKYVEEEQPEEFFIPYVWSLVYHSSNLYWNPSNIRLFTPQKDDV